jgi:arylsulfatase A-like enzyme
MTALKTIKTTPVRIIPYLGIFLLAAGGLAASADPRPNLIVIFADDLGMGDLGAFRALYPGGERDQPQAWRHTPTLDRLANEGVRFTRAYATSWCAPSRQVILSGQWANRPNAYNFPWIGATLREKGYATAMIGKSHGANATKKVFRNNDPQTAEFDDILIFDGGMRDYYMKPGERLPGRRDFAEAAFTAEGGEYLTDVLTDRAVDFITRQAGRGRPFMLYLPHLAPHSPLQAKPGDLRKLFPETFQSMSDDEIRETAGQGKYESQHYAALVHSIDRSTDRIMEALQDAGVADNTVVILTSDNGAIHGSNHPFTGNKWDHFEGGIRVPMILWTSRMAGSPVAGSVYDSLVSLADVAPTLYALSTNDPYPHPTDGIDLVPHVMGEKPPPQGRQFFWANATNPSLRRFMTDFTRFEPESSHNYVFQSVLVEDQDKIIRWRIPESDIAGMAFKHLPGAHNKSGAAAMLAEQGPLANVFPESDRGLQLSNQWRRLVNEEGLLNNWSGDNAEPLAESEQ